LIIFSGIIHYWIGAVLVWMISFFIFNFKLNFIALAVGSLFPDTDTRKSLLGRLIPLWILFKHRGFTHRLYGLLLFTGIAVYLFGCNAGYSFCIGYFIHLIMDSFTKKGNKWL
jgi:inner membrane protein